MKNYCMNFVSIKNLEAKAVKNIQAIKGGEADSNGSGTRKVAVTTTQTQSQLL